MLTQFFAVYSRSYLLSNTTHSTTCRHHFYQLPPKLATFYFLSMVKRVGNSFKRNKASSSDGSAKGCGTTIPYNILYINIYIQPVSRYTTINIYKRNQLQASESRLAASSDFQATQCDTRRHEATRLAAFKLS